MSIIFQTDFMKKLSILLSLLIISCSQEATIQQKKYFDLADFINKKTTQLIDNQPVTQKNISVDDKTETIETSKIDWKKELELFAQADLNKQAYQASYDAKESPNLLFYTLKNGEDLPVKSLKIELDSLSKTPKNIEATLRTKNYLYESEKHLQMTLADGKLKNYLIEGSQELFLGSKKRFRIAGHIK